MSRVWNIREQAEIARRSFDERPAWVKRVSYFAGANTVCTVCGKGAPCDCVHAIGRDS